MSGRKISQDVSGRGKRARQHRKPVKEGSSEEVLLAEVQQLLNSASINDVSTDGIHPDNQSAVTLPEKFSEIEVPITYLSSTGDGLGLSSDKQHVFVVPFALPGDIAKAKVVSSRPADRYSVTDFLGTTTQSTKRDETRIQCPYFSRCSGCQLQMLPYEDQLVHKRSVIERAYRQFSNLSPEHVPSIDETVPSPLRYGYRTKLTPHFDGPPGSNRKKKFQSESRPSFTEVPPIGFNFKNQRKVLDLEDCPIATQPIRDGLKVERTRIANEIDKYKRGATLLLRENTIRKYKSDSEPSTGANVSGSTDDKESSTFTEFTEVKTYTTDMNGWATEYVDGYVFHNIAGAFFQNNNSILPKVTQYIRDNILQSTEAEPGEQNQPTSPIVNLLDAYCGSGFFTITLSKLFQKSIGIDISESSINCARKNAEANGTKNTRFIAATASRIFADLDVEPDRTAVVIDPPRKGCDEDFIKQLLEFGPRRIVYVSCNVHTQARDVGAMVDGRITTQQLRRRYEIEKISGFDFFPQTGHVESVAVLNRIEQD